MKGNGELSNACKNFASPGKISQDVSLALDNCLSKRRHHQLAVLVQVCPNEGQPHLGGGPRHLGDRQEGLNVGGQGGHRAVGVAGGVHRQATPRQEGVYSFQGEDGE